MKKILLSTILCTTMAQANYLDDNLKKETWNGVEVVWLQDNTFPTYDFSVYFHGGALEDKKAGESEITFAQLTSGTNTYSQEKIVDTLEYYGVEHGANVTHEYTTYSVQGLMKDLKPTMKMICHLFKSSTFPNSELKKTKKRAIAGLEAMVTDHGALSRRIFREISLRSTAYSQPTSGKLSTIKKLKREDLVNRLSYYNNAKKRIYLRGPKGLSDLKGIIANDCGWTGSSYEMKLPKVTEKAIAPNLFFIPVPGQANQAQIRIGRYMTMNEASELDQQSTFASKYLGGGFTSRLMNELRVKRGLTYSVGAYASTQRTYGRSGISTFTKNENLIKMLQEIKNVVNKESTSITDEHFNHSRSFLKGNYLFSLESSSAFLSNLMALDHSGIPYGEIYKFEDKIDDISKVQLQKKIKSLYKWDDQFVVIVGNPKLIPELKKAGYKVKKVSYKKFL